MREAHPLAKRVAETLDIGEDDDLFGRSDTNPGQVRITAGAPATSQSAEQPSFGDALLGLLGSTTAGSAG